MSGRVRQLEAGYDALRKVCNRQQATLREWGTLLHDATYWLRASGRNTLADRIDTVLDAEAPPASTLHENFLETCPASWCTKRVEAVAEIDRTLKRE